MNSHGSSFRFLTRLLALAVSVLLVASCATPSGPQGGRRMRPAQTPLEGKALLFDGAVEMRVTLAPFFLLAPEGARPRGGPGGEFRSTGRRDGEFGPPPMGAQGPRGAGGSGPAGLPPPTHRLRVSFKNLRPDRIQFDVFEVRSLLGVFGVRPNRLVLDGHLSTELDPMRSSMAENFEALDVTVNVRHAGKTANVPVQLKPAP